MKNFDRDLLNESLLYLEKNMGNDKTYSFLLHNCYLSMKALIKDIENLSVENDQLKSKLGSKKRKNDILDFDERKYLDNVIKPFRNRVLYIVKYEDFDNCEFIAIEIFCIDGGVYQMLFPSFSKNTMYKNMQLNKEYSLKELGL